MSSSRRLVVRPAAQEDIRHILHYTLKQWGERQWERYGYLLDQGLGTIQQFPDIGRQHIVENDVIWTYPVGQHMAVYTFEDDRVDVMRIVHQRQSIVQIIQPVNE